MHEYMVTWADPVMELEVEGWELVRAYSMTGPHHPPTLLLKRGSETDNPSGRMRELETDSPSGTQGPT